MTHERISLFEARRRFADAKGTIVLPPHIEVTGDAALCYSDALSALYLVQQERDELRDALRNILDGRAGARDAARAALATKATKEAT